MPGCGKKRRVPTFAMAISKTTSVNHELMPRKPHHQRRQIQKQGLNQIGSGKNKEFWKTSIIPPNQPKGNLVGDEEKELIPLDYSTQIETKELLPQSKQLTQVSTHSTKLQATPKNVNAIFTVINYPKAQESQEKEDVENCNGGLFEKDKEEKCQLSRFLEEGRVGVGEESCNLSSSEPGARIRGLITELEKDLERLHEDFSTAFKRDKNLNSEIGEQMLTSDFADLFERTPPDEKLLKQYFPSMYKTTDEVEVKPTYRTSAYQNSAEILEEVQNRMRILSDNLDWNKITRYNNDMNEIYNSFAIDPNILTSRLQIKKLVDDCISSLEAQVKEAVDKQLQSEEKQTRIKEKGITGILRDRTKKNQVSRLCRKQATNPAGTANRTSVPSAKSLTRSRVEDYLKSSTKNRISFSSTNSQTKENVLRVEREPFLWDENTFGYLNGNLLGLSRSTNEYRPYFHLQNSLSPEPTSQTSPKKLIKPLIKPKTTSKAIYSSRCTKLKNQSATVSSKAHLDKNQKSGVKITTKKNVSKVLNQVGKKKIDVKSNTGHATFFNLRREKTPIKLQGTSDCQRNRQRKKTVDDLQEVNRMAPSNSTNFEVIKLFSLEDAEYADLYNDNKNESHVGVKLRTNYDTSNGLSGSQKIEDEINPQNVTKSVVVSSKKRVRFQMNHRTIPIAKRSDYSPERSEDLIKNGENNSESPRDDTLNENRHDPSLQELSEKVNEKLDSPSPTSILKTVKFSPDKFRPTQKKTRKNNRNWSYFEISNDDIQAGGDYFRNELESDSQNEDNQNGIKRLGGGDSQNSSKFELEQENGNYPDYHGDSNPLKDDDGTTPESSHKSSSNDSEHEEGLDEQFSETVDEAKTLNDSSEMSSGESVVNDKEETSLLKTIEDDSSSEKTNSENMVHKSESDKVTSDESNSELSQIDLPDVIELPGFNPTRVKNQKEINRSAPKDFSNYVKTKYKLPSSADLYPQNQRSAEQLILTAQDWVQKELVARTLALRMSQGKQQQQQLKNNNETESQEQETVQNFETDSSDEKLIQNLVHEILTEKALELLQRRPVKGNDQHQTESQTENEQNIESKQIANPNEEIISSKRVETPLPTPPPSPVQSYSDAFEEDDEELALITTPSPSINEDNKNERLSGGGKFFESSDSPKQPFAAYSDTVDTPTSTTTVTTPDLRQVQTPQTPSVSEPSSPLEEGGTIPLHRVPEQPALHLDRMTQTSQGDEVIQREDRNTSPIPLHFEKTWTLSSISIDTLSPPPKQENNLVQIATAEKATSAPSPEVDSTSTSSSPIVSSISEGEWIHLRPWQSVTPFVRYTYQPSPWNTSSVSSLDNTFYDLDDIEQDAISEGEIRIPNVSAWRTSFLAAAIASGIQPQAIFDYNGETIIYNSAPGPSNQVSTIFPQTSTHSLGEVVVVPPIPESIVNQQSGIFIPTSVPIPRPQLTAIESKSSTRIPEEPPQADRPNRVPVQHITIANSTSQPNDDEALLQMLQQTCLPAEPGLVLPVSQSLDPAVRRQFLERLVSEGEIRSSFPLSSNRASDPDHIRSWGRSYVMTMAKRTTSAPGLYSYMRYPLDNGKQIPTAKNSSKLAIDEQEDDADSISSTSFLEEIQPSEAEKLNTKENLETDLTRKQDGQTNLEEVASTSRATGVTFREFPLEMQEGYPSSLPKTKFRKSALKKSKSKLQQEFNSVVTSPTNNIAQSSSTSGSGIQRPSPTSSGETFQRKTHHMMVRSSPGMLPEDFQGQLTLHAVQSKSAILDTRQDMFKESSGNVIMGSLGTIDEESSEVLPGPPKRKLHSSDSDGEYPENNNLVPVRVNYDKNKKVIDRSLSHSTDLSEGEVPARETRSHQ